MTQNVSSFGENNHYQTTDTALVAWLYSQGVTLIGISIDYKGKGVFTLDDPDPTLIRQYTSSQAIGNVRIFLQTYRMLVDMYHNAKREARGL